MTMLLITAMAHPSFAVFADEPEEMQSDMLDYVIYREDGTIRETGTMPNGEPKTRYNWDGITLYNGESVYLKPVGTSGLFATGGTRIQFSHTLDRLAYHHYALSGNHYGYVSSGYSTSSAGIINTVVDNSDYYYGYIINLSSDPFTIIRTSIVF